jgi:HlyD family secretion protein
MPMDREIAPEVRRRSVLRRVAIALVGLAALVFTFAATLDWLRPSLDRDRAITARVERGSIESSLSADGTVVPLVEQVVSSPVEARVLRIARRAGDRVKAGDEILALDTSGASLEAARSGDVVTQKENEELELRLRLDENVAALESQLEQKKLDAEILRYTADQRARLRAQGLIAEQDALSAAAAAKKSEIEVRQLGAALERARRSRDAQLAAARKALAIAVREHGEARRPRELARLKADRDGVVTWTVPEVGATVRRGDAIARIADLSAFRVEATISDVHAARLSPGMPVQVSLDGGPIPGTIETVDPRIVSGVVKFFVRLETPSDRRLRNNLRVDVSVVTGGRKGTLTVRRGALGRSSEMEAWVVRENAAVRIPVRFGLASDNKIEILEGVSEGDELVISDMSDFDGVDDVRLD